jgi:hypothetical protein
MPKCLEQNRPLYAGVAKNNVALDPRPAKMRVHVNPLRGGGIQ